MSTRPGHQPPDHVFVAPSGWRHAVGVVTALAVVGAAVVGWMAWRSESVDLLVLALGSAALAVVCWVYLAVSTPQRVLITGSTIEIKRGAGSQTYDLEDPGVDLLVRDGSVAFGHYRDNWTVVEAREVDWPVFMDVVMRYQAQADHNAEERDRRFSK